MFRGPEKYWKSPEFWLCHYSGNPGVKALNEVVVLRTGFNPARSTSPCHKTYACIQHTVIHHTKMNLSTVKWAQWDKTKSRELLGLFICVCIHCAQLLHTILHRTELIIFPLTLQRITIAPMMSIWGKGDRPKASHVTWEVQIFHGKGQFWWIGAPIVKYRHFLP